MTTRPARPIVQDQAPSATADAFLWPHLGAPVTIEPTSVIDRQESRFGPVIDVTPIREVECLTPAGMFTQWPLDVLAHINKPFTGLVVLIDLVTSHRRPAHNENLLQSLTGFVASLLGENDFGCRTPDDEFVMICTGLGGQEAQRRLNQISEQLWQFQQRGNGAFSLLFSWGGLGAPNKPLADAMVSAVQRMSRIYPYRNISSKESVNHHRKVV
jgi:hypothetical protein